MSFEDFGKNVLKALELLVLPAMLATTVSCGGGGGSSPEPNKPAPTPQPIQTNHTPTKARDSGVSSLNSEVGSSVDVKYSCSDQDGDTLTYSLSVNGQILSVPDGSIQTQIKFRDPGIYEIVMSCRDSGGLEDREIYKVSVKESKVQTLSDADVATITSLDVSQSGQITFLNLFLTKLETY